MSSSPGDTAAKVVITFIAMAAFNATRRKEIGPWFRAKVFNAGGGGSPAGVTTFDVFTGGGMVAAPGPVGGAVGAPLGGGGGGALVAVAGAGKMSTGFASRWVPMAAAARIDGIVLTGSAWRSNATQIALRGKHGCGGSKVYDRSCKGSPPTAVPGKSRHETGDAIDVKLTGAGGRKSPEFKWLAAHAGAYGIKNLPSEPWHWSIDGS